MRTHYHNRFNTIFEIEPTEKRYTFVYSAIGWTIAGTVAAGIYSMSATNSAAKSQKTLYENQAAYRMQQAEIARKAADRNITSTQLQASEEAKQLAAKTGAVAGSQKATLGASGVGGGSVTAADIVTDTFDKAKLDEIALRYNADSRSEEYENQARNSEWEAKADSVFLKAAGQNAIKEGKAKQISTALSTATAVAGTLSTAYGRKTK